MKLPRGATGFDAPAHEVDLRAFHTACHHAVRVTGGTVTQITGPGPNRNFHTVEIGMDQQRFAVLRHATVPLAAIAGPLDDDMTFTFGHHPGLAAAITDVIDVHLLTAGELNTLLSRADVDDLGRGEPAQIAYWRPGTVGELLFNFWD